MPEFRGAMVEGSCRKWGEAGYDIRLDPELTDRTACSGECFVREERW